MAVIPYTLAIFAATVLIVRLFDRLTPRQIGRYWLHRGATAGLTMMAFAIRNDWGTPLVILSLIVLGLGEGALMTLLFNVLVRPHPKSWRATWAHSAARQQPRHGLGTAIASVRRWGC